MMHVNWDSYMLMLFIIINELHQCILTVINMYSFWIGSLNFHSSTFTQQMEKNRKENGGDVVLWQVKSYSRASGT